MPSGAKMRKVYKEARRKNLGVLANTPQLNHFFSAKLSSSNLKAVALTRAPENVGGNHNICFDAPFTLSLAGHTDMLFFRCFCCISGFLLLFG